MPTCSPWVMLLVETNADPNPRALNVVGGLHVPSADVVQQAVALDVAAHQFHVLVLLRGP